MAWRTSQTAMHSRPLAVPDNLPQQPLCLPLHRQNIGPYLRQRAQRLRLVKVAREADLVPGPDARRVVPGVRRIGQHLARRKPAMPPSSSSGTCSLSGSYSTTRRWPSTVASTRVRFHRARLVGLLDDGRGSFLVSSTIEPRRGSSGEGEHRAIAHLGQGQNRPRFQRFMYAQGRAGPAAYSKTRSLSTMRTWALVTPAASRL